MTKYRKIILLFSFKPSPASSPNEDFAGVGFAVVVPGGNVSATLALTRLSTKKY